MTSIASSSLFSRRLSFRLSRCSASPEQQSETTTTGISDETVSSSSNRIDIDKLTKQTAATFAPRPSTATKNPAVKGSLLYDIFEWQAWISMAVGGLLSFNIIWPTDEPSIARLLGMWSVWMFTVPSLRAKECMPKEKEALNLLFVLIPLMNVALPFVWKSFPFIFTADVVAVVATYYSKGVWREVYGLPFGSDDQGEAKGN